MCVSRNYMKKSPNKENELLKNEIKNPSQKDKQNLLNWAIQVREIQENKSLTRKQKINYLRKLNNKKAFFNSIKLVPSMLAKKWRDSNLSAKLTLIGGSAGLFIAGIKGGAGIAALGGAIGLPFFLLTAAGGAFIGTIIDNLKNKKE